MPNASYRWFEIDVMPYINNHAKVFRLKDVKQKKQFGWSCTMEPWFSFLHFLHQRKWCDETFFKDPYLQDIYTNIMKTYTINTDKLGMRTY